MLLGDDITLSGSCDVGEGRVGLQTICSQSLLPLSVPYVTDD